MNNFNISYEFVDNLGSDLAKFERRWNGIHVCVSKTKFAELTPAMQYNILVHEANHAIVSFLTGEGVELPLLKSEY